MRHFPGRKQPANALDKLLAKGVTWQQVFNASDVGKERNLIANRFVGRDSKVLDVGCGRGYFSFACARRTGRVTSLDPMDGGGREGWWEEFKATSERMGASGRISEVRASASSMPFGEACFDVVASVHSIRNFKSKGEVLSFFREAKRLLKEEGRLVVVESRLGDARFPVYNAFYSMRTRLGWELVLPQTSEMVRWLRSTGFSIVSCESLATDLEYAPVHFPFDPGSMKGMKEEYQAAMILLLQQGERHPPIDIITASQ